MTWTVALDLLMTVLLAISIAAMVILNRRLTALRAAHAEMEALSEQFRVSTTHADEGVAGLKVSVESLQQRLDAARALADDLQFLIDRGGETADRLETEVRSARRVEVRPKAPIASAGSAGVVSGAATAAAAAAPAARAKPRAAAGEPRSAAERHLLAALRARG